MIAGMWLDPAAVRDAAGAVEAVAARVDATLGQLAADLDAEGACWGTDAMGAAFGESYVPAANEVRAAFSALSDGVGGLATALRQAAGNAADSDQRAENRMG
ncbi:MAG TPA: WXG100 family type VII secretion target [Micromonosporaceae bacterium]|nr:WXG100 family type VII secretion target [Micromonosporaceae bacterium]